MLLKSNILLKILLLEKIYNVMLQEVLPAHHILKYQNPIITVINSSLFRVASTSLKGTEC